jgi:hypothetical protein
MNVDALDEALVVLEGLAPEYGPGLSNHGPMAAEALVALGRPEDVAPFVAAYRLRLEPAPGPGRPLTDDEWEPALGRMDRWPDWLARFDGELADRSAGEVVAEWVPRLAPGVMGGATHGLIRTAHAWRALAAAEADAARRHELAEGLAYWAARYLELPGPPLLVGRASVAEALAALPVLPEEAPEGTLITDRLRHLQMVGAPFEQGVASLGPPSDLSGALAALAAGGAGAYLANAGRGREVALVHTVTAPMALDLVLPALRPADRPTVFAYAWQAVAALHVTCADVRDRPEVAAGPSDDEALAEAAATSGDEHAIKLVEAGRRAFARTGASALPAAAADAVTRLARH